MDIPLTWRMPSDGAHTLACGIIDLSGTPLEAVEDLVTTDTGVTGAEVSWTYAEEVEETPMVTIAIALIVFLLGVAGIARVAAARTDEGDEDVEDGKSYLEEVASPEESHESAMEQEAEADIEEQSPESTEEPTDVAPWDEA